MTSTELQIKNIVYEEFSKLISNIEGDFKTNFVKKRYNFLLKSISRFATCYDGKGDGTPDGAIGKHLDRNQILIGKEFWEEILEDGVSYNDFILAYQEAYKKAKVEETVIG